MTTESALVHLLATTLQAHPHLPLPTTMATTMEHAILMDRLLDLPTTISEATEWIELQLRDSAATTTLAPMDAPMDALINVMMEEVAMAAMVPEMEDAIMFAPLPAPASVVLPLLLLLPIALTMVVTLLLNATLATLEVTLEIVIPVVFLPLPPITAMVLLLVGLTPTCAIQEMTAVHAMVDVMEEIFVMDAISEATACLAT